MEAGLVGFKLLDSGGPVYKQRRIKMKSNLFFWGAVILVLVCIVLWILAPQVLALVATIIIMIVVTIFLFFGHDRWGWSFKGILVVAIAVGLALVIGYQTSMTTSRPPVYIAQSNACDIYKAALGVDDCSENTYEQLCSIITDSYGGINCNVLFEALQADAREGDQNIPSFQAKYSLYVAAKNYETSKKFEVSEKDTELNLWIVGVIFLIGIAINFVVPVFSKIGGTKVIVAILSIALVWTSWSGWFWRYTSFFPNGVEAIIASKSLFWWGFGFQFVVGFGLIQSVVGVLKYGFAIPSRLFLPAMVIVMAIATCWLSPIFPTIVLFGRIANWVATSPLTVNQAIFSVCLGQLTAIGAESFIMTIFNRLDGG